MEKIYFLINPVSGNGKGKKVWEQILPILKEKQVNYDYYFTKRPGHAAELVKELCETLDSFSIVGIGGDGTVHEIAEGVLQNPEKSIVLGYIPAGSGNDYGKALSIPSHPIQALNKFLNGKERKIDVARLEIENQTCYTINAVGIGFDGEVAYTVNQSGYKKWLNFLGLGRLSYVIGAFQVILNYKPVAVDIEIDFENQRHSKVWLVAIANAPYYGGGMKICPGADQADGLFNICLVKDMSKWKLLTLLPSVFSGKHIHHRGVIMLQGSEVKIETSHPVHIQGDGEIIGKTPVKMACEHKILNVRC